MRVRDATGPGMPDTARDRGPPLARASAPVRALLARRLAESDGHALLARALKAHGIGHAYGVSGAPVIRTFAACAHAGVRPIGVRHQQAAVLMSLAHNYVAGRLGSAVILSSGPAITNAATGILVAHDNCWPLVVLGGSRPLAMHGAGSFQELDAARLFAPLTKWSGLVSGADELPAMLAQACLVATAGRPGPVYLDISEEALHGRASAGLAAVPAARAEAPPAPDSAAIDAAARLLAAAERPLVILGKGLRWPAPYAALRRLVEGHVLPFIGSPMGSGTLPDDHPMCVTAARGAAQAQADVVLLLGARLDWTFRYGTELAAHARLIQVDVEPAELGRNRAADVGLAADAGAFLDALLPRLASRAVPKARARWLASLAGICAQRRAALETRASPEGGPMTIERLMRAVRAVAPREATIVLDGKVTLAAGMAWLPSRAPATRLTPGSNGCMGTGVPFGIGAALAVPARPVIVVTGDFAFGLNAMELETALRHRVPLVVVIANNASLGGDQGTHALYPAGYPDRLQLLNPGTRYDELAAALGVHGEHVAAPADLEPALARALGAGAPAVVNVMLGDAA